MDHSNILLHWLRTLDQHCILCYQTSQTMLCPICEQDLNLFHKAGYPSNLIEHGQIKKGLPQWPSLTIRALSPYHWPVEGWLKGLKFQRRFQLAPLLGQLFCHWALPQSAPKPQVLLPVPLSPLRYGMRGFNQATLLANAISEITNIEVDSLWCRRRGYSRAQSSLTKQNRKRDLSGVFQLIGQRDYRHLAIVDDVLTTGATVRGLYQCLHQALPDAVIEVWVIALSLPDQ